MVVSVYAGLWVWLSEITLGGMSKNGEDEENGCVGYDNCLEWEFYCDADNDGYKGYGLWEKTRFLVLTSKLELKLSYGGVRVHGGCGDPLELDAVELEWA